MTAPRMTTIIAWRDRPELGRTLRHNAPFLEAMRSDVIVVNCGGDSRSLRQLLAAGDLPPATPIDLPDRPFNKSFALNVGVHEARPGVVFILDADILLTSSLASYAEVCAREKRFAILTGMTRVPPKPAIFAPPRGSCLQKIVVESSHVYHWADGGVTRVLRRRVDCGNDRRLAPGILIVRKDHLVAIGGYRSDLVGWGWEDLDLQVRLWRLGLECTYVDEEIRHLEHGDELRDLHGPKAEVDEANRLRVWRAYCAGTMIGTYATDIEACLPALQPRDERARLASPLNHQV